MQKFFWGILMGVLILMKPGFAQDITVVDEKGRGIHDAIISAIGSSDVFTDVNGIVSLDGFADSSLLTIRHYNHFPVKITKENALQLTGRRVTLKPSQKTLPAITIGTPLELDSDELPIDMVRLDPEKYKLQPVQTTADMLAASGSVFVQKSQYGGGSPMIRGFSANRILIVVDGVRMNNAIFRGGNLQNIISVDAFSIDEGEVILGPGSMLYGSDALGGVIDFHSIEPKYFEEDSSMVSGNAVFRTSSASLEKTIHANLNYHGKRFSLVSSFTTSDYGDLRMGSKGPDEYLRTEYVERINGMDSVVQNPNSRIQVGSGYKQMNALNKFRFRPHEDWDISYAFHWSETTDIPRYDRLIQYSSGSLRYGEWSYGPQKWQLHSVNVIHEKNHKLLDRMKVNFGIQKFEESRNDRSFGSDILRERTERVASTNLGVNLEKTLKDSSNFYYGVDFVFNTVRSYAWSSNLQNGESTGIASRYPDNSRWESNSAYLSYKRKIGHKVNWLSGIRYNRIFTDVVFDTSYFQFPVTRVRQSVGALSGSTGIAWRFSRLWRANANVSTGFRAPNIDDLAKVFDSEPGNVIVPNENLQPEYAYTADMGVKYTDKESATFETSIFYTILDNAMVRGDYSFNGQDSILYDGQMSKVEALVNSDQASIYGISVAGKWNFIDNMWFKGACSYQHGSTSEGQPLRHVAPVFMNAHITYELPKWQMDVYTLFNGGRKFEALAADEQDKPHLYARDENGNPYLPSWYTINLSGSYSYQGISVVLGIENLLDKRYRSYSSGITAPGRNIFASVTYKF